MPADAAEAGANAGRLNQWTPWQPVTDMPATTPEVLAEILDGGQAFRWSRQPDGAWLGIWAHNVARVRVGSAGKVEWCARAIANHAETRLKPRPHHGAAVSHGAAASAAVATVTASASPVDRYFGADARFPAATDALPWRSDPHLARCIQAFPGLRILRQPFGETLLCFLCSATKQIVQIKQMVALLAARHGEVIGPTLSGESAYHALPTWEKLATVPERELRDCLLGFRAKFIAGSARFLARHPGWLDETEGLPYAEAKERLCSLPGVGEKIADCVLLFGAGRLEAFPVDVWILRTLAQRYALHGWKPAALSQFGRVHFGAYAGLAQQFLFAWERRLGREHP